MIKTIEEAEAYLRQFYAKVAGTTGKDVTVDRMWPLLARAGNPQERLRVVHIAGTSGKTSTAYFIAALLHEAGQTVGLSVSPHVSSITERLQFNGAPSDETTFCRLFDEFITVMGEGIDATYFELMITFVLWAFDHEGVEWVVLETGLGGMHDSTNVFTQLDKLCVITDIGLDHQAILGDTIPEIAAQKAGIIQSGNDVFMYRQSREVMDVFEKRAATMNAHLHVAESGEIGTIPLPVFQQRNWALAKVVYDFIAERDGLPILDEEQLAASQISVPGRMQEVQRGSQLFILDGAHNEQKMAAFVDSFRARYPEKRVPLLLAMKRGKDHAAVINILRPIAGSVICAGFKSLQDMPIVSIDPEELAVLCRDAGLEAEVAGSIAEGLNRLAAKNEPVNVVTGSFYMLGEVSRLLN